MKEKKQQQQYTSTFLLSEACQKARFKEAKPKTRIA